jgi:uncharacterized membrane protein
MTTKTKIAGIIAAAAAIAFVTAPVTSTVAFAAKKVPCYGVNSCKGKSQCKTSANACKGQNACKGKGAVLKTEKQCKKMHGSTTEEPKS